MKLIDSGDPGCKIALELTPVEVSNLFKLAGSVGGPHGNAIIQTVSNLYHVLNPIITDYNRVLPEAGKLDRLSLEKMEWEIKGR